MKIGFIGLGNMGRGIAGNLLRAGYTLAVYNRTRSHAEELQAAGAHVADSPAAAATDAEVLITMLSDDQAVEQVIFGTNDAAETRGAIHTLQQGAVHISMSTISKALSARLAQAHHAAGQHYLAAPVFGRPEAAAAAKLWVVAAGPTEQIERCRPLFDAVGQGLFTVGTEAPIANVIKLAGNFMIASLLETLGEAFALVRKSGADAAQFLDIMNALFRSPVVENYGKIIVAERYEPAGFKLKLGLKDVRLVLEVADAAAAPMPIASLIRDHFLSAIAHGQGDVDWAALARVAAENAGLS